jgi:hypothetical protein
MVEFDSSGGIPNLPRFASVKVFKEWAASPKGVEAIRVVCAEGAVGRPKTATATCMRLLAPEAFKTDFITVKELPRKFTSTLFELYLGNPKMDEKKRFRNFAGALSNMWIMQRASLSEKKKRRKKIPQSD